MQKVVNSIQVKRFESAARALGCDENEATFNDALGKVARHKPTGEPPGAVPKPAKPTTTKPAK